MENYIVINGKKAELTEEQLKQLGIKIEKTNPFKRAGFEKDYYSIDWAGHVRSVQDSNLTADNMLYEVGNYCTDKELLKQRAMHETLNRLLWRFACENGELENEWKMGDNEHWEILRDPKGFFTYYKTDTPNKGVGIYFPSLSVAKAAVKMVINPFLENNPDFIW